MPNAAKIMRKMPRRFANITSRTLRVNGKVGMPESPALPIHVLPFQVKDFAEPAARKDK